MQFKEIWSNLPQDIRWQFESSAQILNIKRGEIIYREAEQPKGLYFVKKGLVGLVMTGRVSAKEHLLRFFRENQFFGHRTLFSNEGYHGSTVALEATTLKLVPQHIVLAAIDKYPVLLNDVVLVLAKELRRAEVQHVMILENQVLTRVAQALIYLKELHPEHNWTRQEIANFCASTVSTIIKILAELEEMGLIMQKGREILILNRLGLLALLDEQESDKNRR